MLQSTRNSTSIEYVIKLVSSAENWCKYNIDRLLVFLSNLRKELIIAYNSLGYPAATTLYWFLTILYPERNPVIHDSDTIALYRLVYREKASIIFFTTKPNDPSIVRLSDASRWTGGDIIIVSPPPEETIETLLRGTPMIKLPKINNELYAALYEIMLSYLVSLSMYKGESRRISRLKEFSKEGYSTIVREIYEKYKGVIDSLKKLDEVIISSTWFMESSSYLILKALEHKGKKVAYIPLSILEPRKGDNILLISSSLEESIVKEKKFKAFMNNAQVYEILFNLDPLDIPLYTSIVALLI